MRFVRWFIEYADDDLRALACLLISLPLLIPVALALRGVDRLLALRGNMRASFVFERELKSVTPHE